MSADAEAGRRAREAGTRLEDNPWQGTGEINAFWAWVRGWREADDKINKAACSTVEQSGKGSEVSKTTTQVLEQEVAGLHEQIRVQAGAISTLSARISELEARHARPSHHPIGCGCPPASETFCQNPTCPRRNPSGIGAR